jgi:hypothetical protein
MADPKVSQEMRAAAKQRMDRIRQKERARDARAAATKLPLPPTKHTIGETVRIDGPAKVETVEDGERISTDHQGSIGLVEKTGYESPLHPGQACAVLRTEDNQVRVVPEARLSDYGKRKSFSIDKRSPAERQADARAAAVRRAEIDRVRQEEGEAAAARQMFPHIAR